MDSDAVEPTKLLLKTKLHAPSGLIDLVHRGRLVERLEAERACPLTLVSAPAGYGKSVLVASWLEHCDWSSAWLSLDEEDSDLRQFLDYFVAAVRTAFPRACEETLRLVRAPQLPRIRDIALILNNDLDALDQPVLLVLDDYHLIDAQSPVNEVLQRILDHPPIPLHLVIVTRRDPSLALVVLRAKGQLNEIRMHDLRFDTTEAKSLLESAAGLTVSADALANLDHELEGWATGLRLVVLATRNAADPETFLTGLHGGIPQTQEYLLNEVLAGLSPADHAILLKSSILDRYCADLIDAVCMEGDQSAPSTRTSQAFVDYLQQSNLFTFALDPVGQWFRYHHLFQTLLRRHLQRVLAVDDITRLHLRASTWLEANGETTGAVRHALAGGAEELAAEIIERRRRAALEQDQWVAVQRWLDQLPTQLVRRRPDLVAARAWVAHHQLNGAAVASSVEQLETLVDDTSADPLLLAELNFFRSFLAYWAGDGAQASAFGEQALGVFPKSPGMMAGETVLYAALGRQMSGDSEASYKILQTEMVALNTPVSNMYLTRLFGGDVFLDFLTGRLAAAGKAARRLIASAKLSASLYAQAWGEFLLALNHFHSHRLEEARRIFVLAAEHRNSIDRKTALHTLVGLALVNGLMQRPDGALRALAALDEFVEGLQDAELDAAVESCRARVALLLGAPATALAWARSVAPVADSASMFVWLDDPSVTQARVRIVAGDEAERREGLKSLDETRERLEALHNLGQLIDVDAMRSLALSKLGRTDEAFEVLQSVVTLAAPGGWIRPFVELGQAMAELLAGLDVERADKAFVRRVLASFPGTNAQSTGSDPAPAVALWRDLTPREFDILELVAQRLQNKEIAARLFVSPETVKTHLKHLFDKLGVTNRREAAAKAAEIIRPARAESRAGTRATLR